MLRQEHQEQERYYDEANLLSFLAWYSLEFQDETARTNIKNAFKANREVFEVPAEIQLLVQVNNLDLLSILNDEAPISTNSQIHSSPEKENKVMKIEIYLVFIQVDSLHFHQMIR